MDASAASEAQTAPSHHLPPGAIKDIKGELKKNPELNSKNSL
jgi:hypothetical protein